MHDVAGVETRQRAFDRGERADAGVEHEQLSATAADNLRRDLVHEGFEGRGRQAAAAGIGDEGRIISVSQRRPDQRIDRSANRPARNSA